MPAHAVSAPATPPCVPDQHSPDGVAASGALALRLSRPTSTSVVVHIIGTLGASTTGQLRELLAPRLNSDTETVILDLSQVRSLDVAGLELLAHTRRHAANNYMAVRLVDGPDCVEHALTAASWPGTVPIYPTVTAATAGLSGHTRENPINTQLTGNPGFSSTR